MSSAIFPGTLAAMPGLAWSVKKTPKFNTKIQTSVANIELRATFTPYPLWTWELVYNVLRGGSSGFAEFETLAAFYLARQGAYDSFLYEDPSDYSVTDQAFGTGTGAATVFPLVRTLGSYAEFVYNVHAITNVKVAGTPTGAYTQTNGVITFSSPPANGAALTWTGTYYWRTRFSDDSSTFEEFAYNFWSNKQVNLTGIIGS